MHLRPRPKNDTYIRKYFLDNYCRATVALSQTYLPMSAISIFDIFKVGVGPSSSHTIGPWKAALDFVRTLPPGPIDRITVELYGSLSKTGKGHATDAAVQLGLLGYETETVDTSQIPLYLNLLSESLTLELPDRDQAIVFSPQSDVIFTDRSHPAHPNTMVFTARVKGGRPWKRVYASVGGGFIQEVGRKTKTQTYEFPFPIETGKDLLRHVRTLESSIAGVVMQNELSLRSFSAAPRGGDEP